MARGVTKNLTGDVRVVSVHRTLLGAIDSAQQLNRAIAAAKLAAAAPDLLAALKEARREIENAEVRFSGDRILELIDAAIAKAEGLKAES